MNSKSWALKRTTPSACSLACRQCGIRPMRLFTLGRAGVPASDPAHGEMRGLDSAEASSHRRRLEGQKPARDSRAAGTSSSTTSSILTWMTARMVCLGTEPRGTSRTGAISASPCSAPSTGFFRCSARTADGHRSTKTTTAWCSSTCRSPITTPCSIPPTVDITGRILEMHGDLRLRQEPSSGESGR